MSSACSNSARKGTCATRRRPYNRLRASTSLDRRASDSSPCAVVCPCFEGNAVLNKEGKKTVKIISVNTSRKQFLNRTIFMKTLNSIPHEKCAFVNQNWVRACSDVDVEGGER